MSPAGVDNREMYEGSTRSMKAFTDFSTDDEGVELTQRYEILREVGRGGCAVVYEAIQKSSGAKVALKVLSVAGQPTEQELDVICSRFRREAKLIAALNSSSHVVGLLDSGKWGSDPCMVLEFLDGIGFDNFLADYTPLPPDLAVKIIIQVLQALVVAHSKGIVHRDIKPSNVILLEDYDVRVLDFGIASFLDGFEDGSAQLTQQGSIRGTPSYMAPELFAGTQKATPDSDLYAVGLMLLECFTGKVTYDGTDLMKIAYRQVNEKLKIPNVVPFSLRPIIARMCDKKSEKRYQRAEEVIDALLACQLDASDPAKQKLRWLIVGCVVLFLCLITSVVFMSLQPDGDVDFTPKINDTVAAQYADGFDGTSFWFSRYTRDIPTQTIETWGTLDEVFSRPGEQTVLLDNEVDENERKGGKRKKTPPKPKVKDSTPLPTMMIKKGKTPLPKLK